MARRSLASLWMRFWMLWAGRTRVGRIASRLARLAAPPHRARNCLAKLHPLGYIDPDATVAHDGLELGAGVFIDADVVLYHAGSAGRMAIGDRVHIYRGACLETANGGQLSIGPQTTVHSGCRLMAHGSSIHIGRGVAIAPGCAFYPYDHGIDAGTPIRQQPLTSRGDIIVGDDAWLGTNVVVLSGVVIGNGAVIGAGAVVTRDVPGNAIAVGNPARVIGQRPFACEDTAANHESYTA